jgi:hypothetical protein
VFSHLGVNDRTCSRFRMWDSMTELPAMAERFYAAGEERAKMALPDGYGYPIKKQDNWLVTYMFMNHRSRTDSAYIGYRVTVDTRNDVTPVEPYWLDVENCNVDPVYDVAGGRRRGSHNVQRTTWTVPKGGRLIAAGGHVHGGGQALALTRPDCGASGGIYTSRPTWGGPRHPFYNVRPVLHEPGPIHMSGFNSSKGIPLAAGERVVLKADYDAALPHTRVMGIMIAYVAPDPSVSAKCAARPDDMAELPAPAGPLTASVPRAHRGPSRRQGSEHQGAARQARARRQARDDRRRRPLLPPRQRDADRGRDAHVALRRRHAPQHHARQRPARVLLAEPLTGPHLQEEADGAGHLPALLRPASGGHDGHRQGRSQAPELGFSPQRARSFQLGA